MKLIIAEKPDLAKAIALAMPGFAAEKDGIVTKGEYTITSVFGHMMQLKEPEDYDEKYSKWRMGDLPIYFAGWQIKQSDEAYKVRRINQIRRLLKSADIVIHAGDPDDEGQLLIDEILRFENYKGRVYRLDTADTTTPALEKSLQCMKDNKQFESQGWAAYGRSVGDLMVGVNMSRYFTCLNHKMLTVGRVQTPTLGLVVARDLAIENHICEKYYELFADTEITGNALTAKFIPDKDKFDIEDGKLLDKASLEAVKNKFVGEEYSFTVSKKNLIEQPPLPFNLVKLQTFCGRKYKYSPKEVMEITQDLREKYKAITYNRSDCQYLTENHYREAPETVKYVLRNMETQVLVDMDIKSKCFNDANITAHFAIIPTATQVDIALLTEKERNVYTSIAYRYLVQFMPPAEKIKTELAAPVPDGILKAASTQIFNPGFLIYGAADLAGDGEHEDEQSALSALEPGEHAGEILSANIVGKETKPPARYTQSALNEDMTRIAKYVEDPEIKKLLLEKDKDKKGENGSIGTAATRSTVIEGLIKRNFLSEEKGKLISTALGREFYNMLPDEIKKPDMTAKWWVIQERIKEGIATPADLEEDVLRVITNVIAGAHVKMDIENTAKIIGACPACGRRVIERQKGYFCEDRDCGFVLWKIVAGKDITARQAATLFENGKTSVIKGFTSKTGKSFEACLVVNQDKTIGFEFGTKSEPRPREWHRGKQNVE